MSNLVKYAEEEMKRAGLYDKDADYGGMIPDAVMALVKAHAEQGHSGFSHGLALSIFNQVINFKPLTPIGPEDFVEVAEGVWQCKRAPSKFLCPDKTTWYDIDKPLRFRKLRRILKLREFSP